MIQSPLPGLVNVDYRVVQWHGERPEVYKQFGLAGHNGIDIAPTKPGTRGVIIYAPHDGIVHLFNEGAKGYGRYMEVVDLDDGRKSILAHLERHLVPAGKLVRMGEPVAIMGGAPGMDGAGFSTGIHLHWGYKQLAGSTTLNWNNGYKGAIDIVEYVTLPARGTRTPFLTLRDFQFPV